MKSSIWFKMLKLRCRRLRPSSLCVVKFALKRELSKSKTPKKIIYFLLRDLEKHCIKSSHGKIDHRILERAL